MEVYVFFLVNGIYFKVSKDISRFIISSHAIKFTKRSQIIFTQQRALVISKFKKNR